MNHTKWTQKELEQELKNGCTADKEIINDTFLYYQIENVMNNIENMRKKQFKTSPRYTQAYVAKKAGISLSAYKSYLHEGNINIKLKTVLNIMNILQCEFDDIFKSISTETESDFL